MRETAHGQVFDILGDHKVSAAQQGKGLRGPGQCDARPGAATQVEVAVVAAGCEYVDHVAA
jgi:hypothetical protein